MFHDVPGTNLQQIHSNESDQATIRPIGAKEFCGDFAQRPISIHSPGTLENVDDAAVDGLKGGSSRENKHPMTMAGSTSMRGPVNILWAKNTACCV